MQITAPVTDYIPASILTTLGDHVVRGAAIPERAALRAVCRASRQFVQAIPNITWTDIEFDVVSYDRGTDFDLVNHRFVCPRDGQYLAIVNICFEDFDDGIEMRGMIRRGVNSRFTNFLHPGGAGNNGMTGHCILNCTVGEFITARVYQASGGAENLNASYNTLDIIELY